MPTNCDAHLVESLFQTRPRAFLYLYFCQSFASVSIR
ncbi:MAG: DUF6783 domain-containing protein [Ruminococcus sp.]